jgi:hypothetical protein
MDVFHRDLLLPLTTMAVKRLQQSGVGARKLERVLPLRMLAQRPFYGLFFALIADKSPVRLSQPIPGFLGAGAYLDGNCPGNLLGVIRVLTLAVKAMPFCAACAG